MSFPISSLIASQERSCLSNRYGQPSLLPEKKKKKLTAIWLPHSQLWTIHKKAASPTRYSLRFFNYFDPKVTGSLVTRLG